MSQNTTGGRIRLLRHDLGLSQQQLAERAQVDRAYLSMIENNKRPAFGSDILQRIASALGTTTDYILGLSDDPLPPPEMVPEELPADERLLHEAIERLPPAIREQAVEYLIEEIERMERLVERGRQMEKRLIRAPAKT